ncbi:MAG TPA: M48 family metalloprotease [Arenicellales bacterium]|nr:M48 family metalloprotease [Arenicellales bacterium]
MSKAPERLRHPPIVIRSRGIDRRRFLWLMSAAGVGLSTGVMHGCATDPVTGKTVLVGMSESQEINVDRQQSPHQFSADYGPVQDGSVNAYLSGVGKELAGVSHRPDMPYSYRAVNANHVNAYAFPGGSIAVTRGILVEMENEAELAGLLGHETGHVAARHAAEQAGKTMVTQAAVMGGSLYASTRDPALGRAVAGLGSIGAGALLAHYSRNNEREADRLGMEYMVQTDHSPEGMVGLMDVLRSKNQRNPSAMELMFSTHPPSEERYQTARRRADEQYAAYKNAPLNRERFMDETAPLHRLRPAIIEEQKGEREMGREAYTAAEGHFRTALDMAPSDYTGNVLLGKSLLAQEKPREAKRFFQRATEIYPQEAQAHHLVGMTALFNGNFDAAYEQFDQYENLLPGNPNTIFLKGYALESMDQRRSAAREYYRYLQQVNQGQAAQYSYKRLQAWGYL